MPSVPAWMGDVSIEGAEQLKKLGYTSLEKLVAGYAGIKGDMDKVTKMCSDAPALSPGHAAELVKKIRKMQGGNKVLGAAFALVILAAGVAVGGFLSLPLETRQPYLDKAVDLYNRINEQYKAMGQPSAPSSTSAPPPTSSLNLIFVQGNTLDDIRAAVKSAHAGDTILDLGGKTFTGSVGKKPIMVTADSVTIRKGTILTESKRVLQLQGDNIVLDRLNITSSAEGHNTFGARGLVHVVTATGVTVKQCTIQGAATAVSTTQGGEVTILSSQVRGVTAEGRGSKLTVKKSKIDGNAGKGVMVEEGALVELDSTNVTNNGDEALIVSESKLVAKNIKVKKNGSCLWADGGARVEIRDSYLGGTELDAIHAMADSVVNIFNSEVQYKRPTQSTGAEVYIDGVRVPIHTGNPNNARKEMPKFVDYKAKYGRVGQVKHGEVNYGGQQAEQLAE